MCSPLCSHFLSHHLLSSSLSPSLPPLSFLLFPPFSLSQFSFSVFFFSLLKPFSSLSFHLSLPSLFHLLFSLTLSLSHKLSFMLPSLIKYSIHQNFVVFPIEGEVYGYILHCRILEVCNKVLNSSFLSRNAQSTTSDCEPEPSLLHGNILTVRKNNILMKKTQLLSKPRLSWLLGARVLCFISHAPLSQEALTH